MAGGRRAGLSSPPLEMGVASCTPQRHIMFQENTMPKTQHDRAVELHNLAAHAHAAAAVAHGKGDHLTAHELTKQAREHSMNAQKLTEELVAEHAKSGKP